MVAFVPQGRQGGTGATGEVPSGDLPPGVIRARIEEDAAFALGTDIADEAATVERRNWVPSDGYQIIACVDVEPVVSDRREPVSKTVLWDLAVRRMERAVRPGDWICMLGGRRLAVCFGNGAHQIEASDLGRRLVRAMGNHLAIGSTSTELNVGVGIGVAPEALEPATVTQAAISSIRTARHHLGSSSISHSARFVAVSNLPEADPAQLTNLSRSGAVATHGARSLRLARRSIVRLEEEKIEGRAEPSRPSAAAGPSSRHSRRDAAMRILIVDPEPSPPRASRLGAAAVATIARRVGAMPTMSTAHDPESVLLDHCVVEPHAVVLVLHPEPAPPSASRRPDPWEEAARLTRSLCDQGSSLLAVSFGASALTVAACVEQGAVGLFELEALPDELARVAHRHANGNGNGNGNGNTNRMDSRRFPAPYRGLVELTPAERRVLYQMMRGRSAAEIAAEHVVSLSTVRTHIRSILRKLDVNSQLAAVAIANGTIPLEESIA
jgi:DNA-binding CsgD family transcriptional regulator